MAERKERKSLESKEKAKEKHERNVAFAKALKATPEDTED